LSRTRENSILVYVLKDSRDRVNPLGGAIALGHPLGASGVVLMTRMINHMRDHDLRYGLQTMCEGGGTSNATLVELVLCAVTCSRPSRRTSGC
jgi:acetyl-CoA acetyltransferase